MFALRACSRRRERELRFDTTLAIENQDFIVPEASLADQMGAHFDAHIENPDARHPNQHHNHHHRQGSSTLSAARKSAPPAANPYGSSSLALAQPHSQLQQQQQQENRRQRGALSKQAAAKKAAYCSDNRRALQRWQANDLKKAK